MGNNQWDATTHMRIQDILRAQYVKRWTIVNTTRNQSLAEHTFNVTMIARAICKVHGIDDVEVMKACLAHDLDEILTGDIPTPTKIAARGKGWDLNKIYERVTNRRLNDEEMMIVKAADAIETSAFLEDNSGPSRHNMEVGAYVHEATIKILEDLPEKLFNSAIIVLLEITDGEFTNA